MSSLLAKLKLKKPPSVSTDTCTNSKIVGAQANRQHIGQQQQQDGVATELSEYATSPLSASAPSLGQQNKSTSPREENRDEHDDDERKDEDLFLDFIPKSQREKEKPKSLEAVRAELINTQMTKERSARLSAAGFSDEEIEKMLAKRPTSSSPSFYLLPNLSSGDADAFSSSTSAAGGHLHSKSKKRTVQKEEHELITITSGDCIMGHLSSALRKDQQSRECILQPDTKTTTPLPEGQAAEDDDDDEEGGGHRGGGGGRGGFHFGREEIVDGYDDVVDGENNGGVLFPNGPTALLDKGQQEATETTAADEEGGYRDRKKLRVDEGTKKTNDGGNAGASSTSDNPNEPKRKPSPYSITNTDYKPKKPHEVARFNRNIQRFAIKEIHPRTKTELRGGAHHTRPPPGRR